MPGKIIPYLYYKTPAGKRFGLCTAWKPDDAVLTEDGFTIAWPDGTEGTMRGPFPTVEAAQAYLDKVPAGFTGMNQG